jgi:hypothetical protein
MSAAEKQGSPSRELDTLAEIGPLLLTKIGAEVAWHGPSRWRGTGPDLALSVWPRVR